MELQHIHSGDKITAQYLNSIADATRQQTNFTDGGFVWTPKGPLQINPAKPEQFGQFGSSLLDVVWGPATKNVVCHGETDSNRWQYRHIWINLGQSLADFCQIASINTPRVCVNGVFAAGWNNGIDNAPDAIKLTEAQFAVNDADDDKATYNSLDVKKIRTSAEKVKCNYTGWVELPINTLSVYPYNDSEDNVDTFAQNGVWMHFFAKYNQVQGDGNYYTYVPNIYICFSNTRTIYNQTFADQLVGQDVHATNIRETEYPPIKIASVKLVDKMIPGSAVQQGEDPNKNKTKVQQLIQITKGFPMLNQYQEMIGQVRVKFSGAGANLSATAWVVMPQDTGAVSINLESGKLLFEFSPTFCVNGTPIFFPIDKYILPNGEVRTAETPSGVPGSPEGFAYGLDGNQKAWLTFCSNQSWSSLGGSLFTKTVNNDPLGVSKKAYVGGTIWAIPKWNAEFNKWTVWFEIKGMSSFEVDSAPERPSQSNDSIVKPMPICIGSFIVPAEEAVETTINVANISQTLFGIGSVFSTTTTDAFYGRRTGGYETIDLSSDVCKSLEYEDTLIGSHPSQWVNPQQSEIELDQTLQIYGFRNPSFVPDEAIKSNLSVDSENEPLSSLAFIMRNQVTTDGQDGKDVEVNYMDLSAFWRCISSEMSAASGLSGDANHFAETTIGPHSIYRPTISGEPADYLMLYDFYDNTHNIDISSIVPKPDDTGYDNSKWQILVREWTDDEDPGGSFLKYASLSSWPTPELSVGPYTNGTVEYDAQLKKTLINIYYI